MAIGRGLLVAVMVAAGLAGGLAAAKFVGGPLGFLSFHINGTGENITWVPVYFDLGTLNENQTVNVTGTATITLPEPGVYVVNIVGPQHYARVFSYFHVKLVFDGNKTVSLTLRHPFARVKLAEGTHVISVTLEARVRSHLPSITVDHAPFIAIHPAPHARGHGSGYGPHAGECPCGHPHGGAWHGGPINP